MAEGIIKKLKSAELQNWEVWTNNPALEVYPVTATSAVFDPKTNQSLDDILASINIRIALAAASGGGGTITSVAGLTYIWAFAGFKGDNDAITDIQGKANTRGIPSGWQESSNVKLEEGEMLYMTTARKQGDEWLTWTDSSTIWSAPVRLGSSGTTSGTGSDGQGYNYIYCRTDTGLMPSFLVMIEDTALVNAVEEASKNNKGVLVKEEAVNVVYEQSNNPTDVWYDHPDGVTATIPYEWILVYLGNEEEWVLLTPLPVLWSKYGVNGQDGDGVEYVFCTIQETDAPPTIVKNNTITGTVNNAEYTVNVGLISSNEYYLLDDFIPDGWYDLPQEVSLLYPKLYVSIRKKKWVADEEKSKWGLFTEPKIWSEIPIVVSGLDKLSIDWSNDNVNVVTGESGDSLKAATDNYLTVKLGDTLLPYSGDTLDDTDANSYAISNVEITTDVDYELESYSDEEDASAPAQARFYITSLPGTQRLYTVKFTLKVRINGTIYTLYSTINVYVKDVAYELVVYPKGFNLSAIDTAAQENLTVQVKMRNATTNRFLTGTEIKDLGGDFQYKFIKDYDNNEKFVDFIPKESTTVDELFVIDCKTLGALNQCRAIEIKLTSSDGYEDSETVMIARDGNTGDEGSGIEYIFYLADGDIDWNDSTNTAINAINPHNWNAETYPDFKNPEFKKDPWTDDLQEVTESNPVQYVSVRRFKKHGENTTKSWGAFEKPVVYNRWVPSPYSLSISNDSVIIDDNTDSITLANASFCLLHIFSGQEEITTNSEYTFEITPLANNGANGIFNLYQASKGEISTINNSTLITGKEGTLKPFGGSISITGATSNTNGGIAFYIKRTNEDAALQINSYGIQYLVIINKAGSQVASLYKVLPIKVANFSADGTIYKLNITNDTWTYSGDDNKLVSSIISIVTVAEIKGATANLMEFSVGSGDPPSNSLLYVKTSLKGTLANGKSYSILALKGNTTEYNEYTTSSHSLELYFNGTLVDAETIDCRKDGKTGEKGNDGSSYYLTCDNDNIIIDLDTTDNNDIEAVSTYTLLLWESGKQIDDDVNYTVTLLNNAENTYHLSINNSNAKSSYFQIVSGLTLTEGSFLAKATASINDKEVASKIINVIIKLLKGVGVSYKLMVSPNTLHYDGNGGTIAGNSYSPTCTVTKISNGEAATINDLNKEGLSITVFPDMSGTYKAGGYDYTLTLNGIIVDKEHIDCLKDGKLGGTGPTGPGGDDGVSIHSNSSFYIDMLDTNGPSLHINANFNCTEELNTVTIYWGDKSDNIVLISNQLDELLVFEYSISIPYKYITTGFQLHNDYIGEDQYKDIEVTDCGELSYIGDSITNGWGTCTHITLVTLSKSGVTDTKVVYRTGTEGYYFDTTSNHFISAFSKAENIHPLVTANNLDLFEVQYSKRVEGSSTPQYNKRYNVEVNADTNNISIEDIPAATISGGQIIPKDGFTLITDGRVNGEGTVTFKSFSKSLTIATDTPWNKDQLEPVIQVCTVLCYEWSLYYSKEIPAIPNLDYVISFYIRLKLNTNISIEPYVRVELEGSGDSDLHYNGKVTTDWKRFFIKAHNSTGSTVRLVGGALTSDRSNLLEVVAFEIGGFQITRGSDLAPWEPYSGETMSVLLLTSETFNSTVSKTTANTASISLIKTDISVIELKADSITEKVNGSGLEITAAGTTFTGDVKATNFTVVDKTLLLPIVELTYYNKILHGTVSAVNITEGTPILVIYNLTDQTSYIINLTKLNNTPGYTVYLIYNLEDGTLTSAGYIYYNKTDNHYYNKPSAEGSVRINGTYITDTAGATLKYLDGYYAYGEDTGVSFAVLREYNNAYTLIIDTFNEGVKTVSTSTYYKKDLYSNEYTKLTDNTLTSQNILFISKPCYDIIMKYGLNSGSTTTDLMNYLRENYANIGNLPDPADFEDLNLEQSDTVGILNIIDFLRTQVSDSDEFDTYVNDNNLNSDYDAITWLFNTSINNYIYYE